MFTFSILTETVGIEDGSNEKMQIDSDARDKRRCGGRAREAGAAAGTPRPPSGPAAATMQRATFKTGSHPGPLGGNIYAATVQQHNIWPLSRRV